jgi:hypothetical protein
MQLLRFRQRDDGQIRVVVHLDDTKITDEGDPDPSYVWSATWPTKPQGITANAYADMIKREAKLLAQAELDKRQAVGNEGTAIAGEGATL